MIITLKDFCKGDIGEDMKHIAQYFLYCCCNNAVLLGLTIWGTIALNSSAADECRNLDESAGCGAFLTALKVNVIVAYVYTIGHCCLPGPCLFFYELSQTGGRASRYRGRGGDDSFERFDSADFDGADEERNANRPNPMEGLTIGAFADVAGSVVKEREDFCCCFCLDVFVDSDDVTELKCDSRHIFHTSCLSSWVAKNQSCPVCRA